MSWSWHRTDGAARRAGCWAASRKKWRGTRPDRCCWCAPPSRGTTMGDGNVAGTRGVTTPGGEGDHSRGPVQAPATLVVHGDYECPYTRRAMPLVGAVEERLGDRVRFVFRHFPLVEIHPHAQHAAEAAEAAATQGRFWDMHDQLFAHQRALADADLARYAADLGLDTARFEQELSGHVHA